MAHVMKYPTVRIKWAGFFVVQRLLTSLVTGSQDCSLPKTGSELEVQHITKHKMLHEVYPRCQFVDFNRQRLVCEIWDDTDEEVFISSGRSGCPDRYSDWAHIPSRCPDGTLKKTCVILGSGTFLCACHSERKQTPCATPYRWDSEWRNIDGPEQGLYRSLCDHNALSCPVTEYRFGVAHLVEYTQLPDDKITTSSIFSNVYPSKNARIDNYFTICCWTASSNDPEKWVQFALPAAYTGVGFLIRERCDYTWGQQKATRVDVAYSEDGSVWEWAETGVVPDYGQTVSSTFISYTHWFQESHSGRYWRLYIREWLKHPSLKADIIGNVRV